jgi:HEAT repeat protein
MAALAECGSTAQVPEVLQFLAQQPGEDSRLTRAAIEALGGMDGAQVLEVYDRVLRGEESFGLAGEGPDLAIIAVAAGLGHMNTENSRTRLRDLLQNASLQDTELTIQVIRSLGEVGVADDVPLLEEAKVGRLILVSPVDEAVKSIQDRFSVR